MAERSESLGELGAALAAAQGEITNPPKTGTVFYTYKGEDKEFHYAPLEKILAVARPVLARHGLSVVQDVKTAAGENGQVVVEVATLLVHKSGEWLRSDPVRIWPRGNGPQDVGSAMTYGRRYSLSATLGISGEDDDDAQVAGAGDQEGTAKPAQGQGDQKQAPAQKGNGKPISENQRGHIKRLVRDLGWSEEHYRTWLGHYFGVSSSADLTGGWGGTASQAIDALKKELEEKEAQEPAQEDGDPFAEVRYESDDRPVD